MSTAARHVGSERQAFLLALSDAIRPLRDPQAVKVAASRVLGQHLQVNRAFYAEIDGDDWILEGGFTSGVASLPAGRYSAATYGHRVMDTYRAGQLIVFRDTRTDPGFSPEERDAHGAIDILGAVGVPLVKEGRLIAILTVHTAAPRDWLPEEIALVEETAERTWAAVEQAHAQASLRESEARFRLLTESLPQLVWTCLPDGRCDYLSSQWVTYTGVPAAEQLDMSWLDRVIHPEDRDRTREHWFGAVAGRHPYDIEYRIRAADGSYRWFQTRGVAFRDKDGAIEKWFGTCTDIEGQKRANRDLEEFAYVASHDLQEPLRMINIYGQLLVRRFGHGDPEAVEYAGFVQEGITRMETLLRDVLMFSRTTHQDESTVAGAADLEAALAEATAVVASRIKETGALILADPLPCVRGDTNQLALVFQNLLSNALKYRGVAAPEVRITALRDGDWWTIMVRDNGIGFAQQYAERIFGLFKRLHKDEYPGTGLGLAICQRIVQRYGGRMWATSTRGEGATFYFSLPAHSSADAKDQQ